MSNRASNILTLDYHSKQFFDPDYWSGAVEARFYLDVEGLKAREFRGRAAPFCTGEWLAILQAVPSSSKQTETAPIFVRRFPLFPDPTERVSAPEEVANAWEYWLSLG